MKLKPWAKPGKNRRKLSGPAAPANIRVITLLATTDFSEAALSGVRYAVTLAEQLGATVSLLHVIEPPSRMVGMESVTLARTDLEVARWARVQLETLAERERGVDVRLTSCVRTGKPFHEITAAGRECAADLIVIATRGFTGLEHVLLGSTAERVVRHASCPVLTVPARSLPRRVGKATPFKLKKLLVPIDFSNRSKAALPWATFLAGQFNAEIVLLHVAEKFPIDYLLGRELTNETIVPLMKKAGADLKRLSEDLGESTGQRTYASVRDGTPFEEICRAAKILKADLIILSTHGYTGFNRLWLGSTAERVVRHAPCPVLVVREREDVETTHID